MAGMTKRRATGWRAVLAGAGALVYAAAGLASSPERPQWSAIGESVLAAAEQERAAYDLPSIAVGLVDRTGLVWSGAVGHADADRQHPVDGDTLYRIGSISKLFTDVLVMQLVQRGQLDLDAPVTRYLPEFAPRNPFGQPITLRQLMSHRSGLVREPPRGHYFDVSGPTLAETVHSLNATTLVAAPGTVTKYSNAGIAVVGRTLEVVTHQPYEQLMREQLLAPLGMDDSSLRATADVRRRLAYAQVAPFDANRFAAPVFDLGMAPAGNLYSGVADLAAFAASLLNAGQGARGRILEPATLARMWEPQGRDAGPRRFGIGFILNSLDGHRLVGHSGAVYGYVADLAVFPDDGFAVVTMIAVDEATAPLLRLRNFAARQVQAARAGGPPPQYLVSAAVPAELGPVVVGHYSDGARSLDIRSVAGRLYLEAPGVAQELRRREGRWVLDGIDGFRDDLEIAPDGASVTLGTVRYRRTPWARPAPPPADFAPLIGEYGWDHNYLQVYERDGRPYVRIEWSRYEELERVSRDVYRFVDPVGLYAHEQLQFTRADDGRVLRASLNGIVFERRDFGAEIEQRVRANVQGSPDLRSRALAAVPPAVPAERAADLVDVGTVEPGIRLDVRYATTNNFMGLRFYESARAFLQKPAAEALARAHRRLAGQGYGILIHDGYRPWYVTRMFWDATPASGRAFVADPAEGSRHNRGCAADVTLYELSTGRAVQMPGRYDEISARSSPLYVGGASLERWQRDLLKQAIEAEGFDVYVYEWWHFDFRDWRTYPVLNLDFADIAGQGGR